MFHLERFHRIARKSAKFTKILQYYKSLDTENLSEAFICESME